MVIKLEEGQRGGLEHSGDVREASGRQPTLVRTWHERVAGWAPVLIQVQMDQQLMEKRKGLACGLHFPQAD